ncbi:TonB-dependent receptor [Gimibacter soli]|uniref:TonB-dependent receptor n=1 Tax=Gimibacter soli TaxID=3024400 RepID=A0AAE9XN72_9PROT|nr:TonB-dependent receptor [Gimibacter soli]WCL54087.1 TonB-dependent receptor [Gimibacter soli]
MKSVSALALIGAAAGAVHAQEAGDGDFEEITVTGIRGGLRAALDVKRNNDGIVDAISAEDIGKFPDRNVAESLQRVPGVTIQRQFGEGAGVSIRGAGQDLTLTTLNGQNVASTGWFVLEPAKRSFNYELLPSELVGNIQVYKSSQADLAEGGVGGTVVINTRKPLEMDSGSFYASVEGQYQEDSGDVDPQASALYSWKNAEETLGILVSGVYQQRHLQRQGNEAFWEWGAGPVGFEQNRKRRALNATIQWRPTEELDIVLNATDMQMKADNTNYALWLTQGNCTWCGVDVAPDEQLYGTPVAGPLNVAYYQARPREATMNSDVIDLSTTYTGEGYKAWFQVGRTSSTGGTDFEMVVDDGTGGTPIPGGTYDFRNGNQTWDLNGFDLETYDPGSLAMGVGSAFNKTPKTDKEWYVQADAEWELDLGVLKTFKAGVKYADHNTTSRRFEFTQAAGFDNIISTSGLSTGTYDVGAGDYKMIRFDSEALKDWAKASITGEVEDLGAYSEVTEKNFAAYGMSSFEGDGFRGNFGVRFIHTDATSTYFVGGTETDTDGSYNQFLPSLNVAFDVAENVIVRTSAARVMARPQYVDMYVNPNVVGSNDDLPNNQYWIIGNVGLKPFVANQFDVGVEWYFAEGSLLSAAVFMKDVKNFVNFTEYHADDADVPFPGVLRPDEIAAGWTVQEKVNGKAATAKGFEFQYQQEFGNGFGAIANYTFTDAKTDRDTFTDRNRILSDSSKHSLNLTGYYENEDFQARLAYNWRSAYMLRESGSYGNRLHDDYGSLDFSASWFITSNISLKLDVNNILEESSKQFGNNASRTPNSGFTNGFPLYEYEMPRRITLGAAVKF